MSHINVHVITQRASQRIGRVEQVRALAPWPTKHDGDHWQLNRASGKPAHLPSGIITEPWPMMRNQSIPLGVRGDITTTVSTEKRIGFPFVVRTVSWAAGLANLQTSRFNIVVSGEGSIWGQDIERPEISHLSTSTSLAVSNLTFDARRIIPWAGATITLSITNTLGTADSYLNVIIQPLADYLKSLGA
jgi:hypothetical protein